MKIEDDDDKTPTASSFEDEISDEHDDKKRFMDTDIDTIRKSNERVDQWKINFDLIESELVVSDNDDEELSTWL